MAKDGEQTLHLLLPESIRNVMTRMHSAFLKLVPVFLLALSLHADPDDDVIIHKDIRTGPLVTRGADGRLVYTPYTNRGDRIIDYSFAGYKASEEPIPDIPAVATLDPLPGTPEPTMNPEPAEGELAYPKGPDSLARIQAALDDIAAREPMDNGYRGALLLRKGTYHLTGQLTLKPGVVLRGEGDNEDGTVLVFHHPGGTGILMGGNVNRPSLELSSPIADAYVPAGSSSLTVEDAEGFKVGDHIKIRREPNPDWVLTLDMDDPRNAEQVGRDKRGKPWQPHQYVVEPIREITRMEGNVIHFFPQLTQTYAREHGGGRVIKTDLSGSDTLIGVEGLRILSNFDPRVKQTARERDGGMEYFADEDQNLAGGVDMNLIHGWVRDCTVLHTSRFGFRMSWSLFVTIRDSRVLQPVSVLRGGRRYSFSNDDTSMSLVYNCFAEEGRHDYVTGSRDHGPVAFVKSRTLNAKGPSETHQRWATGILFDTIVMENSGSIDARNRGYSGSGHGWAGANVVIWNSTAPSITVENPQTPEQNFAIGCTADLKGDGFIENSGDPVESESLFTRQLIDRIGEEKAMAVLK
jgi:hypothetical protein